MRKKSSLHFRFILYGNNKCTLGVFVFICDPSPLEFCNTCLITKPKGHLKWPKVTDNSFDGNQKIKLWMLRYRNHIQILSVCGCLKFRHCVDQNQSNIVNISDGPLIDLEKILFKNVRRSRLEKFTNKLTITDKVCDKNFGMQTIVCHLFRAICYIDLALHLLLSKRCVADFIWFVRRFMFGPWEFFENLYLVLVLHTNFKWLMGVLLGDFTLMELDKVSKPQNEYMHGQNSNHI